MTRAVHSNCVLQILYALLRGVGKGMVVMRSRSRVWPFHFCLLAGRGYVGFETTYKDDRFAPWWFEGRWRRLSSLAVERRTRFVIRRRWPAVVFVGSLMVLAFPLWSLGWAAYPWCYVFYWGIRAIHERHERTSGTPPEANA